MRDRVAGMVTKLQDGRSRRTNLGRNILLLFSSRNLRNRVYSPPSLQFKRVAVTFPGVKRKFTTQLHLLSRLGNSTGSIQGQSSESVQMYLCFPSIRLHSINNNTQSIYIYIYIYIYDILPYQIQHNWLYCLISYNHKTVKHTEFSNVTIIFYTLHKHYPITVAHSSKICYHKSVQGSEVNDVNVATTSHVRVSAMFS